MGASNASGYDIDYSCKFKDGASGGKLTRTQGTPTGNKAFTYSFWFKGKSDMAGLNDNKDFGFLDAISSDNDFISMGRLNGRFSFALRGGTGSGGYLVTTQLLQDPASWYHMVCAVDTSLNTGTDRMRMYKNGTEITAFDTDTIPAQDYVLENFNTSGVSLKIGQESGSYPGGAYMAEIHFIDGQQLTPSSFGELDADTNQWKAIKYDGTYGDNGFFLEFDSSGALGTDTSGNGNNFTVANMTANNQMIDTPQNSTGGNFATLNPLAVGYEEPLLSEGNLKMVGDNGSNDPYFQSATIGASSGKWYAEFLLGSAGENAVIGVMGTSMASYAGNYVGNTSNTGTGYYPTGGTIFNIDNVGNTDTAPAAAVEGDIIGVLLDLDDSAGKIYFYKNNTILDTGIANDAANSYDLKAADPMWTFAMARNSGVTTMYANFGADSSFAGLKTAQGNTDSNDCGDFYYTPPAGYLALCTNNLADPSIALPGENFNSILYTGDGGTSQAETGVGFQPDLVWGKAFVDNKPPWLFDSVRGVQKLIESSSGGAQTTPTDMLNSFDSDGFTHGNQSAIGGNGNNYIAWNWKAGGAGVANTSGSIDSTVSANTTSGFSVVTYTGEDNAGDTVGHGLSQAPELILVKDLTTAEDWQGYDAEGGPTKYIQLNDAGGYATDTTRWNDTAPTTTVFSLGTSDKVNDAGDEYVAYCFHSVEGYSKIAGYTGNGNANGAFIYTGFEPKFLMCKKTNGSGGWAMIDRVRYPNNVVRNKLWANLNDGVVTAEDIVDFNSNGFKWRIGDSTYNGSNDTYLFLAFAEIPFKTSNAI